jgi:hypothetical protein
MSIPAAMEFVRRCERDRAHGTQTVGLNFWYSVAPGPGLGGHAMGIVRLALSVAAWLVFVAPAWAQGPAAVVEDVSGKGAGVEFMDYVAPGKVIRLGRQDSIVLGYLKSCWRETIVGGTVTVGAEQSDVQGGKVERTRVKCDAGRMQLSAGQAVQSAGYISRNIEPPGRPPSTLEPQITLYGRIPTIQLGGGGTLVIERLDVPGEKFEIAVSPRQLARGVFFDLAKANRLLAAGGLYRATFGTRQVVFKIAPDATASAPVVARLLPL